MTSLTKLLERMRARLAAATPVVGWYAHRQGDQVPEATVRGPFFRWLKVMEVDPKYREHVADAYADAEMFAHAPTDLAFALDALDIALGALGNSHAFSCSCDYWKQRCPQCLAAQAHEEIERLAKERGE